MVVRASAAGIVELLFPSIEIQSGDTVERLQAPRPTDDPDLLRALAHVDILVHELSGYFAGTLSTFIVALDPQGTDFQKKVWLGLQKVPYGTTRSYKDQAINLGNMQAIRAVAKANADNPIAIVIPCHRIIGTSGELTGYAGGLWRKRALLDLEQKKTLPKLF